MEWNVEKEFLKNISGIIDNSGMRLFYTDRLRKFDAGIIEIGLEYTDKNSIPPRQDEFVLSGHCLGECTEEVIFALLSIDRII